MTKINPPKDDHKAPKRRKLSHEILGLLGVTFAIAFFLFEFLSLTAAAIVENYCDTNDLTLTYAQYAELDMWILSVSFVASVVFFAALFLFLLGQRISYIKIITEGVEALRAHRLDFTLPVEGNNELTELAETINFLSAAEKEMREKERLLQEEKEQLIRSLSHDIRTPLTSIMSYSELLLAQKNSQLDKTPAAKDSAQYASPALREKEQLELILKKAQQIKELTDILLDGGKREPEFFRDGRLLMEQLAAEMDEELEAALEQAGLPNTTAPDENTDALPTNSCGFSIDLSALPAFSGTFDVGELRRIFDNLTSNILKYADLAKPASLSISMVETGLVIRQENFKRADTAAAESYKLGLAGIRRIAHNYGGGVEVQQDEKHFTIIITLSEFHQH